MVAAFAVVVRRIRQPGEREDGDLGHFLVAGFVAPVGNAGDEGADRVPGDGPDVVQATHAVDRLGRETDLLVGLPEGSFAQVGVGRFAAAAGETHLSGVVGKVVGPLREQEAFARAVEHRHDDGCLPFLIGDSPRFVALQPRQIHR